MKIIYILWSAFIFFNATIYSQWTNQNLVPEGNHLWSTYFVNDNNGWIVGSGGFIKKTTNAGLDWIQQNSGTTLELRSVQFIDQNTGWICGEGGLLIKTTDGGENWFGLTSGTTELLTDIQFLDVDIGFTVGSNGTVLKTTNGGLAWVSQYPDTTYDLYSVDFVNDLLGYAVGGGRVFLKTTDGGLNWIVKILDLIGSNLNCIEFISPNVGLVGYGEDHRYAQIIKTTDGGETWSLSLSHMTLTNYTTTHLIQENITLLDTRYGIHSIYFKDSNTGFAVGGTGDGWSRCIFSTTNAGATWQTNYSYQEQTGLLSVFVNSTGQGWAVGYYGVMYMTEDNGSSWSQILSGTILPNGYTGDWITTVFMINDSIGWAGGSRKGTWYYPIILKTTNGGKIWETNSEFDDYISWTEAKIFFLNENIGWVSFYDRGSYKTTDGGNNWFPIGDTGNEKFFINQDTGWATYAPLGVFKSTDGGSTWVQKSNINSNSLCFSDINNGWAVGAGGSILKSTDEGETWISKTSGTTSDLNSVNFYGSNIGICVGNSGTVLLTTNGGESWTSQNVGTSATLNSILFTNATTIWIAGSDGTILNTTDLGNNWISYNGITGNNLVSTSFVTENTGWFGGWNGTILKYQNDVIPVELVSFTADVKNSKVLLNWQTATELNNFGYEIERKVNDNEWNSIGFVEGHGNSTTPNSYSFTDNNLLGGNNYQYRLKQIDLNGKYEYSNEIEVEIIPGEYVLYQNYPNPFNPSTKIKYVIPAVGTQYTVSVQLKVYDILGNEVATLVNEKKEPGNYEVEFSPGSSIQNLPAGRLGPASGIYFYRLTAGDPSAGSQNGQAGESFVETKKMILVK